jgi:hypothetical protein
MLNITENGLQAARDGRAAHITISVPLILAEQAKATRPPQDCITLDDRLQSRALKRKAKNLWSGGKPLSILALGSNRDIGIIFAITNRRRRGSR